MPNLHVLSWRSSCFHEQREKFINAIYLVMCLDGCLKNNSFFMIKKGDLIEKLEVFLGFSTVTRKLEK